jgi:hypothetical protein|tara:strand:- start:3274 stop:3450 length:177 start_codon:yes stop_codon:yes gene_type:complete
MYYRLYRLLEDCYSFSVWDKEGNMLTFNVGKKKTILDAAKDLNIDITREMKNVSAGSF